MSKYIVYLHNDEEEYVFFDKSEAERFIEESDVEGELIEFIPLEYINTDLI